MLNWACAREAFEFFTKLLQVSSTRPEGAKALSPRVFWTQAARPEGAKALSPGQRPGLSRTRTCRPVRAKALKLQAIHKAFALTGRLVDCHYTQGVALGYELLGLQPVHEPRCETSFYIHQLILFHLLICLRHSSANNPVFLVGSCRREEAAWQRE